MSKERDYFINNLATLIGAGLDILSTLRAMRYESRSGKMRIMLRSMIEEIEAGKPLWRTLEKVKLLPKHALALIKIGEQSGKLQENLGTVALEQQKEREFKSKLWSAMLYPTIVLLLSLVIGMGISWFVLPRLAAIFSQLKIGLPLFTRILIILGNFLGSHGLVVIPSFLLAIFVVFYFIFIFTKTNFIGQRILFMMPGVKTILRDSELARFGYILGSLLEAGLPIVLAIDSLRAAASPHLYKKFYEFLCQSIEEGNSFEKSFSQYRMSNALMPYYVQQMIVAGEKSGRLTETITKIGLIFEHKAEISTKNLSTIIEPLLLIIVWLGVLFVALAVILPIYGLLGGIQ